MITVAQGSRGEDLKFDCTRTPQTTVAVPVTAKPAIKARSSNGSRFHIDKLSLFTLMQEPQIPSYIVNGIGLRSILFTSNQKPRQGAARIWPFRTVRVHADTK